MGRKSLPLDRAQEMGRDFFFSRPSLTGPHARVPIRKALLMKSVLPGAVVAILLAGAAGASNRCYDCQLSECWSSIMYPYKNCIASSSGACEAFTDCWGASARLDGSTASEVRISCNAPAQWELIRSESFTGLHQSNRYDWKVTAVRVQPTLASAGVRHE